MHNKASDYFSIQDNIIIVTGASRGIGYEIATSLSKLGAKVVGTGRSERKDFFNFDYKSLDLNNLESIKQFRKEIESEYVKCDGLINCAGVTVPSSPDNIEKNIEAFKETWLTNTYAPYQMVLNLIPLLKKGDLKSIINVTSIGSMTGFPGNPAYVSSKFGLRGLTASLANDLGEHNIRVNNLVPGYFKTAMTEKSYNNPQLKEKRDDRILLGRWGEVEDLVGPSLFLLSKASSYVTGTDIIVDGGWLTKGIST